MTKASSRARIESRLSDHVLERVYRLIPRHHRQNPLGTTPFRSRFSDGSFALLYAAASFETAFMETVVRDRFVRVADRVMSSREIGLRVWIAFGTPPDNPLRLIDLRGDGCFQLGVPTDAARARNPAAGQALGRILYHEHADVDGLIFSSRLSGNDNFAIFDRAVGKLSVADSGELAAHPELPNMLTRSAIRLEEA